MAINVKVMKKVSTKLNEIRKQLSSRFEEKLSVVASGYGGDMPEDLSNELLDDMHFYYNKVKCRKIERMLPTLNKLVVEEQKSLRS